MIPIGDYQFNDVIVISPLKDPNNKSVLFVPENCQILGIIRCDIATNWVDKFIE